MSNKTAVAEPETSNYRLPKTVVPNRYEIKLTPDLKQFTFAGEESIAVDVKEPVKEILLNAVELEIHSAELVAEKSGTKYSASITIEEKTERACLTFNESIPAGKAQLQLTFTGTLNDKLRGFYRSKYKDQKGNEKWLACTQLEATDARRTFPCWDEPDAKAVFKSTLVVDEHLTALSNCGIESQKKLSNGKKEVVFKETIKMSSYLVAYIVGEFESTDPVMADGKEIRIWTPLGKKQLSKFAEGSAKHALTFFAKYYGVPYAGDKLDLVAIPDFAAGAMENLGCVTFRESALLVDEKAASHAEQERVADVIAHEIAHMWFGDLTTMSWWNGIWLNEAFATFAEMLAVDNWKPEWKRWESFGASRAAAMAVDGLKSTRTIEFPVRWPRECEGMFDVLTYQKGASVLRMLEQYLTEPVFQKGISIYLKKHQFANTETSDLWAALAEASKQPVVEIMDSWIFHSGYPMVSVDTGKDGQSLKLAQQRFYYSSDAPKERQLFQVPVMLRAKVGKQVVTRKILLSEAEAVLDLGGKIEWVVVNEGGHGFYRVRYSSVLLQALTADIFGTMSAIERFNLLSDTWAAVVAGHAPLSQYLTLSALFIKETDKNVWSVLVGAINYMDRAVDQGRQAFEAYVRNLLTPIHQKLGWQAQKGEDELAGQLRGMIIGALGTVGNDPAVQAKAATLYVQYKGDKSSVDPNILSALVGTLAFGGDAKRYDEFKTDLDASATPQDEDRYRYALAAFQRPEQLERTLKMCLDGTIRTQDAPFVVRNVLMNNAGRKLGWQCMRDNWAAMNEKYPASTIPRLCEGIVAFVDEQLAKEVTSFFADHPVKQGGKTLDQHLERMHVAVQFKRRESETLKAGW